MSLFFSNIIVVYFFNLVNMKSLKLVINLLFILLFACCSQQTKKENEISDSDWHNEVIVPYAEAFNEIAKVSPIIGGDTETEWAASQIDSLYHVIKSKPISITEKFANIAKMQSYMAYGISYFLSVVGIHSEPNTANRVHNICYETDSLFNELKNDNFQPNENLSNLSFISLINYNNYFSLYNSVISKDTFKSQQHLYAIAECMVSSIYLYESWGDSIQAYRISSIIEPSAFS